MTTAIQKNGVVRLQDLARVRAGRAQRVLLVVRPGAVATAREHDGGERDRRQSRPPRRNRCVRSNISLSRRAESSAGDRPDSTAVDSPKRNSVHVDRARWWHAHDHKRDRALSVQSPSRSSDARPALPVAARPCTRVSRCTRVPSSASSSSRAAVPAAFSTDAALADHDPLLRIALDAHDRRAARAAGRRRSPVPRPPRWSPRSSAAARRVPCASSCSRTSSAARNDSGWSVTTPVGVVVRPRRAAAPPARRRSASTPSPVARRERHVRGEVAELAATRCARCSAISSRRRDVDLVHREHDRRARPRASRAGDEPVARPDRARWPRSGSTRRRPRPSVVERPVVRALAEQRARLVDAGRVEEARSGSSAVVRTPRTCVRVVCGRSETIETFGPTIWFSSVDLPTFGRPTSDDEARAELGASSVGSRHSMRSAIGRRLVASSAPCDARDDHRDDAPALDALRAELEPVDAHGTRPRSGRGRAC